MREKKKKKVCNNCNTGVTGEPVTCPGWFIFLLSISQAGPARNGTLVLALGPFLHAAFSFGAVTYILLTVLSRLLTKPVIPGHMEPIAFVFARCYHKAGASGWRRRRRLRLACGAAG